MGSFSGGFRKRRSCPFNKENEHEINYLNVELLREHIGETGKIIPSRISGLPAKYQRRMAEAIKRARILALLPYTDSHKR